MKDDSEQLGKKIEWLQERINSSIKKVGKRAKDSQKKATVIKILLMILAGSATILLGLEIPGLEKYFKSIAFVFTAIITLLSTIEPFFNFRGLWIEHERAEYKFHLLQDDINFYVSGKTVIDFEAEKINDFQKRFQETWAELSVSWLDQRQSQRYNI